MATITKEKVARRRIVGVNEETVTNVSSTDYPHHYATKGQNLSWYLPEFTKNLKIQFHEHKQFDTSFSIIGVDASIANAFRRIMIAEIPTLAIEQVYISNNTSIIHDEILAQRLGLVPLTGDQELLRSLKDFKRVEPGQEGGSEAYDQNTVVLNLQVECTWEEKGKASAKKGETDPKKLYHNSSVYAHQMTFEPMGNQPVRFPNATIRPVNPDILLAKMRPGQKIDLKMFANKGLGSDHAKFSPVATASYRLLPTIEITQPILGADADKFARCFARGVISKRKVTAEEARQKGSAYEGHEGETKAVVADVMRDTVSRECLRHEEFKGKVKLGRVRDHFIFKVESTGQYDAGEVFLESVKILKDKSRRLVAQLDRLVGPPGQLDQGPSFGEGKDAMEVDK